MRPFQTAIPALFVLVACAAVYLAIGPIADRIEASRTSSGITLARQVIDQDDILSQIDRAVVAVADSVRPSVVHLDVENRSGRRRSRSNGSGWIYDGRGHIVTNAHVVRGATGVRVEFPSGRVESGEVVGIDPYTDIAVVKVSPRGGVFPLARSASGGVMQGQRAYAFGSPFGFKFSMSEGIVSGVGRVPGASASFGGFTNFIQTDAAVNPGNSGGPLVDARGELIGMNVAIATGRESEGTTEGDSAGISFAIPLETIENVVPQLIGDGRVARGFLGLSFAGSDT
ncbi:MAG: trypsin-like peptidase domain-containing protein, partial [Planctomycetota bacterium]